jgi:DNA-binding CsgD family transcriptional regulator
MQARGGDGLLGPALFHLAELECWAGDPERSRELVRDLQRALSRVKYGGMRTRVAYATALVYAHSGEIKRARRLATTYVEAAAQSGDLFLTIRLEALLGFIALSSGDPPLAAEHLRRASAISEACGYGEPGVVRYAGDEIEALIASGDIAAARASLELLEQRSTRLHRLWGQVIGARSHALIAAATGDVETALALATASIPLLDRLEQPLERGRTLMTIGILHRRLKNRSSARDALAAADAMFTEIGASTWSRQARAEIDRISGRRRQAGGLTPTESRIADMAAAGRTNKEVAAEIHLSVKTVEANLSRIYRKLAVRSRSELAARRRSG